MYFLLIFSPTQYFLSWLVYYICTGHTCTCMCWATHVHVCTGPHMYMYVLGTHVHVCMYTDIIICPCRVSGGHSAPRTCSHCSSLYTVVLLQLLRCVLGFVLCEHELQHLCLYPLHSHWLEHCVWCVRACVWCVSIYAEAVLVFLPIWLFPDHFLLVDFKWVWLTRCTSTVSLHSWTLPTSYLPQTI